MKLSELREQLNWVETINVDHENGTPVPAHFHITELGAITRNCIDCEGTIRNECVASLQLWYADDTEHRLTTAKLQGIIDLGREVLKMDDPEVEVKYQTDTIGRYALDFNGHKFILKPKHTACLASDACGITETFDTYESTSCCASGGKCC